MRHLPSYEVSIFDGDAMFRDFQGDIANRLARLEAAGMMPEAVLLRADLWPQLAGTWNGYPLIRLEPSSPRLWGVLA